MRGSWLGRGSASSPGYCLAAVFFFLSPTLAAQRPWKTETQATSVCHLFSYSRAATEGPRRRGQTSRGGETQCTKLRHSDKINLITKISRFQVTAQNKAAPHVIKVFYLFFFIGGESAWKFRKEIPPLPTFTGSVIIRQTASTSPCPLPSGLAVISPALVCHSSVYSALWHSW